MPPGPAMLAALTDSYLCPTNLSFTDRGWGIHIHPPMTLPGTRLVRTGAGRHPGHRRDLRTWHRRPPRRLAHAAAVVECRPDRPGGCRMRVGLVCPYSFDVPGGVQAHVADLARTLIGLGHHVSVLAPGDDSDGIVEFPDFVVPSGRSLAIPYNGSVARLSFGPVSYTRTRRWIRAGKFDVLHLHEPIAPEPVVHRADGRRGADRRHVPHRQPALALAQRTVRNAAAVHGEDHRPDRGQRTGPAGPGRAPRRRRGDHPQRRRRAVLRRGAPVARLPAEGWNGGFRRPVR